MKKRTTNPVEKVLKAMNDEKKWAQIEARYAAMQEREAALKAREAELKASWNAAK